MKVIFSPSKAQKSAHVASQKNHKVFFPNKTKFLVEKISLLSPDIIEQKFKLPASKSKELLETYRRFDELLSEKSLSVFNGVSFKELSVQEYTDTEQKYCKDHLVILSALYGVVRPNDGIRNYRLDMNNNILTNTEYKNLYNFWIPKITEYFKQEEVIINLASKEYSKLLNKVDKNKIINIHFVVNKDGILQTQSVASKKQRGKMLNYMIQQNIIEPTQLKKYTSDEYIFNEKESDGSNYYFVKQ